MEGEVIDVPRDPRHRDPTDGDGHPDGEQRDDQNEDDGKIYILLSLRNVFQGLPFSFPVFLFTMSETTCL